MRTVEQRSPGGPRIGYVWARPLPSRETDTEQVIKTLDALAAEGADVELIVPASRAQRRAGVEAYAREIRAFYGVAAPFRLRVLPGVPQSRLELERAVHPLVTCGALGRGDYDLLYGRSRSLTLLCGLLGRPAVMETYRLLGAEQPRLVAALARLAARRAMLGIITHSELARRSITGAGFPEHLVQTVHNGYEPRSMEPVLTRSEARAALGLDPDRAICSYTGHVHGRKGMGSLLETAARAPEVLFLIAGGNPADVDALRAECARRGLGNVRCLGWRPAARLPPLLYASDALIIPPTAAPLRTHGRTVLPMKLFSYLAAGRPIVAPDLPDLGELLVHEHNALLTPPDAPGEAAAAIRRAVGDAELATALGARCRAQAEGLTWRARARRILATLARWRESAGERSGPSHAPPAGAGGRLGAALSPAGAGGRGAR